MSATRVKRATIASGEWPGEALAAARIRYVEDGKPYVGDWSELAWRWIRDPSMTLEELRLEAVEHAPYDAATRSAVAATAVVEARSTRTAGDWIEVES